MKEIKLFGKAIQGTGIKFNVAKEAAKKGYIINPECDGNSVLQFLETLPDNVNSTFYKEWRDVTDKSRLELLLDQVMHYSSTYGTNHEGDAYIPNDNPTKVAFEDYKYIDMITYDELKDKVLTMLYSGIALKGETIDDLVYLVDQYDFNIDLDKVKNKEAMCKLSSALKIVMRDPVEMMRYLVFQYTGKTLLIKSPEVIREIKANPLPIVDTLINTMTYQHDINGYNVMASVFHRFKPLFLAMKKLNEKSINKLRRLANKHHKPMKIGRWENVLTTGDVSWISQEEIDKLSNFKKLSLMKSIRIRSKQTGIVPVRVRNGKQFVTCKTQFWSDVFYGLYDELEDSVVRSLKTKACKVKLPKGIKLAAPTSEKSFIGHIPSGSYVDMSSDVIAGIHWTEDGGARDLDLSLLNIDGNKIGWNSRYDSDGVIYSGDMTCADPEATELLYCQKGMPDGVILVNKYSGDDVCKYNFFLATENITPTMNHMVDPNSIDFMTEMSIEGQSSVGMFVSNRFIFMDVETGKGRVSASKKWDIDFLKHSKKTSDCVVSLKGLLNLAGFTTTTEGNADIDLSACDKSTLIDLFC